MKGLPAGVRWLILRILPLDAREHVLGDLEEAFHRRAARMGEAAARRWAWREAVALVGWRTRVRVSQPRGRTSTTTTGRADMGRDVWQDLRFGVRTLARRPGFTLVSVLVLGLGIGAPATVFSLVNRAFFQRPAEVAAPHELVRLFWTWGPGVGGSLGYPEYQHFRENNRTLAGLAAFDPSGVVASYGLDGQTEQLQAMPVSDNYFDVLGVRPELGRFFLPEEGLIPGERASVVLSHGFWQRTMAGAPDALGRTILMNGHAFSVVGVAPEGFGGLSPIDESPDVWVPIMMYATLQPQGDDAWYRHLPDSQSRWLNVVGRLAPGVTFEAATENLAALERTYEARDDEQWILVSRQFLYSPREAGALERLFTLLSAVVVMVLAIAAANVAVMLVARASTRSRELGIRRSMGAGRGRLARQLVTESLLLGLGGGAVGLLMAYVAADLAGSLLPYTFVGDFKPDGTVLAGITALAMITAALVGLAPALHASRLDITAVIRESAQSWRKGRLRQALVVTQVGLSLILVSGALLFTRSFLQARGQEFGFEDEGRLLVSLNLRNHGYGEADGRTFLRGALERISAVPGVSAVTTTRQVPFQGSWTSTFTVPAGAQGGDARGRIDTGMNVVGPNYFDVMRIPLVAGSGFAASDGDGGAAAVVINQHLAETLWPGEDPVGRVLPLRDETSFTVMGVARDAVYYRVGEDAQHQVYGSVFQIWRPRLTFVIETSGPALDLVPQVQATLRELDPTVALSRVSTLAAVLDQETARFEVSAVLVGLFSALALLLAASGLYGVVSFLVSQRTREIGVRMALGARPARVGRQVMALGLKLAFAGLVVGVVGAAVLSRFTQSLLFEVEPADPAVFAAAAAILVLVTGLASLAPASRATRVDPMDAIRTE